MNRNMNVVFMKLCSLAFQVQDQQRSLIAYIMDHNCVKIML